IPQIAKSLLDALNEKHGCSVTAIHRDALQRLMAHNWPGNVRELRNVLEWAVVTAQKDLILPQHLPRALGSSGGPITPVPMPQGDGTLHFDVGRSLDEIEAVYIAETLKSVNND